MCLFDKCVVKWPFRKRALLANTIMLLMNFWILMIGLHRHIEPSSKVKTGLKNETTPEPKALPLKPIVTSHFSSFFFLVVFVFFALITFVIHSTLVKDIQEFNLTRLRSYFSFRLLLALIMCIKYLAFTIRSGMTLTSLGLLSLLIELRAFVGLNMAIRNFVTNPLGDEEYETHHQLMQNNNGFHNFNHYIM